MTVVYGLARTDLAADNPHTHGIIPDSFSLEAIMRARKGVVVAAVAVILVLLGSSLALASDDAVGLTARTANGVVEIAWSQPPDGVYVKLVRSTEDFITDSEFGDSGAVDGDEGDSGAATPTAVATIDEDGWEIVGEENQAPEQVVYIGTEMGYIDMNVEPGNEYYYTLFLMDSATGDYIDVMGTATAEIGEDDESDGVDQGEGTEAQEPADVGQPSLSSARVRPGRAFTVRASIASAGSASAKTGYALYKKSGARWKLAKSGTVKVRQSSKKVSVKFRGLKKGTYRLVFKSRLGGRTSISRPRVFKVR
jgi:hypothetical protein